MTIQKMQWQLEAAKIQPPGPQTFGPRVSDFAAAAEIQRARESLANNGSGPVIRTLMTYLRNGMIPFNEVEAAKAIITSIGTPALAEWEIGERRGDVTLKKNCRECIEAIRRQR